MLESYLAQARSQVSEGAELPAQDITSPRRIDLIDRIDRIDRIGPLGRLRRVWHRFVA